MIPQYELNQTLTGADISYDSNRVGGRALTPGWDLIRKEMIRLAGRRECRFTQWSPSIPCDWAPSTVWDPRFDRFFTEESAWAYIMELLESGCEFAPVLMRRPPSSVAYEIVVTRGASLPDLYIKVQIHKGRILGRSFHNATK